MRVERIAAARPAGIILREKDLSLREYLLLAAKVKEICKRYEVCCILHTFTEAARKLGIKKIHMPMPLLLQMSEEEKAFFSVLGASCHSQEEAVQAMECGCSYITAGHVFDTACKKDMPGRGISFLKSVCQNVSIPVYAIGGITPSGCREVKRAGASGVCVMSGAMQCGDVTGYIRSLESGYSV